MYKLEWVPSPNFTPASQSKAIFGRPRTIEFGAGHWWGDPNAGYSHQGVINTFLNPKRQASAHAVVSAKRVTEMVRQEDVSWATNQANSYTFSIELKPNATAEDKETCSEYIADKGFHNLQWYPHNHWHNTGCNPLPWGEIMERAKQIWKEKHTSPPPPPPVVDAVLEWGAFPEGLRSFICNKKPTKLWNFNQKTWGGFTTPVKEFEQGDRIDIFGYCHNKTLGATYLLTKYSYDNRITNGFNQADLTLYVAPVPIPEPSTPEWQKNLVAIAPVNLMVMPEKTAIYDLNTLQPIKDLARGTWVDFVKSTIVAGKEYLVSSYSAENGMPNGILRTDMGVPVIVPPNEKPEWLQNWEDIADVTMYTRIDAPLVNLLDGKTVKTIAVNTPVEIASATYWHGQKYLITKYSTDKQEPRGIALVDLDMKPIEEPGQPAEPADDQPSINKDISLILLIVRAIAKFFGIKY